MMATGTAQQLQSVPAHHEPAAPQSADPQEIAARILELETLVNAQCERLVAQEEKLTAQEAALHDVYDGMQLALTASEITGSPDEMKIRAAIRKARKSYTEIFKRDMR